MASAPKAMRVTLSSNSDLPESGTAVVVQHGAQFKLPDLVHANKASGEALAMAVAAGRFEGKSGQMLMIPAPAGTRLDRLLLVGVNGAKTPNDMRKIGAKIAIHPDIVDAENIKLFAGAHALDIAKGLALRNYRFGRHKTAAPGKRLAEVALVGDVSADALAAMIIEVNAVHFTRDLVNEPGNILLPAEMADRIARAGEEAGLDVTILDERALSEKGFNLLLGVGQGSVNPPRVVVMRLGANSQSPLALVGKGVTFDTGGVNVKPVSGMWEMKGDMAGAATVAGAMLALAYQKHPGSIVAVLGLAENMTGGSAIRPGDILRSMSGKTVEVRNTDCEGRLVLADCMTYAQRELGADTIVDLATLTYAVQIGLGTRYAGIYSNQSDLTDALKTAAADAGELVWPMPIDEGFHSQLAPEKGLRRAVRTDQGPCRRKLFTVMTHDGRTGVAGRIYSNMPDAYPFPARSRRTRPTGRVR
jgi:leucyl aminopeptidase